MHYAGAGSGGVFWMAGFCQRIVSDLLSGESDVSFTPSDLSRTISLSLCTMISVTSCAMAPRSPESTLLVIDLSCLARSSFRSFTTTASMSAAGTRATDPADAVLASPHPFWWPTKCARSTAACPDSQATAARSWQLRYRARHCEARLPDAPGNFPSSRHLFERTAFGSPPTLQVNSRLRSMYRSQQTAAPLRRGRRDTCCSPANPFAPQLIEQFGENGDQPSLLAPRR